MRFRWLFMRYLSKGIVKGVCQWCNHKKKGLIQEVSRKGWFSLLRVVWTAWLTWSGDVMSDTDGNVTKFIGFKLCRHFINFSCCCSINWISNIYFPKYRPAVFSVCHFQKPKMKCVLKSTGPPTNNFLCSWLVAKLLTKTKEICYEVFHWSKSSVGPWRPTP
jgi:hypothetical protein